MRGPMSTVFCADMVQHGLELRAIFGVEHAQRTAGRTNGTPENVETRMRHANVRLRADEIANWKQLVPDGLRRRRIALLHPSAEKPHSITVHEIGANRSPPPRTAHQVLS